MLNHDNICMRVIHSVVKREKPPSKRPRIRSSRCAEYKKVLVGGYIWLFTSKLFYLFHVVVYFSRAPIKGK